MTALLTERVPTIPKRTISRYKLQLAASVKAYKGGACMVIQSGTGKGYAAPADDAKIGRVVGKFLETVDNSAGLIGAKTVLVDFGRERTLYPFVNDSGDPLDASDREGPAYGVDDQTVSGTVSTLITGVLFEIDADGVAWVEVDAPFSGPLGGLSDVAPEDPSSTAASAGSATEAARQDHKHHIALALPTAEGLMSADQASAWHGPVANMAGLTAIAAANRINGMLCYVISDTAGEGSVWRFHSTSTAADTSVNLVASPDVGSGRWLRQGATVNLYLAVTKDTTDNATIFTVPVGARLHPREAYWQVNTSWTGGTDAAIGVHASPTGWATKGDILGGTGGDVLATLVSTDTRMVGTIGTKLETREDGRLIMIAADTFKFDRIVDAFTAGVAKVRILCDLLANAGA